MKEIRSDLPSIKAGEGMLDYAIQHHIIIRGYGIWVYGMMFSQYRNKLELKVLESEEGAHFILQPKMESKK